MSPVQCLREFVKERLTAATEEIFGVFEKTIVVYEEEISRQRRLLDIVLKPVIKLHKTKVSQSSVCNEEGLADQKLSNQERNVNEEPEPPQIKEDQEGLCTTQEGEQLVLESHLFKLKPSCEGSDHSEDQTLLLDPLPQTDMSAMVIKSESDREGSWISEPNSDQHLYCHSHRAKSQDHERRIQQNKSTGEKPENRALKCLFCIEEFHDFLKLKIHQRTHIGEKHFKCDICGKGFTHKANVKRHMTTHMGLQPFRCRVCGKQFSCQSNCVTHMKTHTDEKPHACITCGKCFGRVTDLKRHFRSHTGEKPYSCSHCGKEFPYHSSLTNHIRLHTGEKPYNCSWCGKRFAVKTTLKIHTRVHTGEKPYKCNICAKNFAHSTAVKLHKRIHAQEKQKKSDHRPQISFDIFHSIRISAQRLC